MIIKSNFFFAFSIKSVIAGESISSAGLGGTGPAVAYQRFSTSVLTITFSNFSCPIRKLLIPYHFLFQTVYVSLVSADRDLQAEPSCRTRPELRQDWRK